MQCTSAAREACSFYVRAQASAAHFATPLGDIERTKLVFRERFGLEKVRQLELYLHMSSLPLDLRGRIVEAYERKEGTYFELAQRFGVGESTVYRLLRAKRERGDVFAGAPSGIREEELPQLAKLVRELPNATLDQLKDAWQSRHRRQLSRSSIVRALRRAGITREKSRRRRHKAARSG